MDQDRPSPRHYLWLLGLTAAGAVLVYLLAPILTPFLLAAVLAYICDPLVDRLEKRRVPRTLGTVLVLLLLLAAVFLLVLILLPLVVKEAALLIERMPALIARANTEFLPWLRSVTGIEIELDTATVKRAATELVQNTEGLPQRILSSVTIGGMALLGFFVNLLLVPVVLFYLLRDWDRLIERIDALIPRRWHARVSTIAGEIDRVLAEFLRGQISVMLLMSVYYTVALWVTGLEFALPIGVATGLLVFVPYLGTITGLVLATLAGALQFGSLAGVIPIWIAIGIGQLVEGMVVTPWLVGDRIGLHPVAVMFALLAFGQLFGFVGILLALPAAAALLVWLRHVRNDYLQSGIYHS